MKCVQPSSEEVYPTVDEMQATTNKMVPGVDEMQSNVDETMPGVDETQFRINKMVPDGVDEMQSNVDETMPGVDETQFRINKMVPGVDEMYCSLMWNETLTRVYEMSQLIYLIIRQRLHTFCLSISRRILIYIQYNDQEGLLGKRIICHLVSDAI